MLLKCQAIAHLDVILDTNDPIYRLVKWRLGRLIPKLNAVDRSMPNQTERKIYRLAGICGFLAIASLIVPRFVSNPEGGFSSGASAVLAFLILLGIALLFSLYLLGVTVQHYRSLSVVARVTGVGPSIVLAAILLGLFSLLNY